MSGTVRITFSTKQAKANALSSAFLRYDLSTAMSYAAERRLIKFVIPLDLNELMIDQAQFHHSAPQSSAGDSKSSNTSRLDNHADDAQAPYPVCCTIIPISKDNGS